MPQLVESRACALLPTTGASLCCCQVLGQVIPAVWLLQFTLLLLRLAEAASVAAGEVAHHTEDRACVMEGTQQLVGS